MSALSSLRHRDRSEFVEWSGPRRVWDLDGKQVREPLFINRVTSFQSVHTVSLEALRAMLPTDELHPVQWFDGRGVVAIFAARYAELSYDLADGGHEVVEPYAEAATIALVSRDPMRRGVPLFRTGMPHVGGFVLDMPVTHQVARDAGRVAYGFPKFVADVDFYEEPELRQATILDEGTHVLTATVHPHGRLTTDEFPLTMYSSLHGDLLATTLPFLGYGQRFLGRRSGGLLLGAHHPMAERLRTLDVDREPIMAASYVDARMILPSGMPVGRARDYTGYVGGDRAYGHYTVSYPGSGAIDQYRALAVAAA